MGAKLSTIDRKGEIMKCDSTSDCYCGAKVNYASEAEIEGWYLYSCESCGRFHRIFRKSLKKGNGSLTSPSLKASTKANCFC